MLFIIQRLPLARVETANRSLCSPVRELLDQIVVVTQIHNLKSLPVFFEFVNSSVTGVGVAVPVETIKKKKIKIPRVRWCHSRVATLSFRHSHFYKYLSRNVCCSNVNTQPERDAECLDKSKSSDPYVCGEGS